MPRSARIAPGGLIYHVLNRAVGGPGLFRNKGDFAAFEDIFVEALERQPIRVLGYCFMPTHWHLVLWPRREGELSAFVRTMTLTHAMRWHAQGRSAGPGHLYQGRFKSFPIQPDEHLLTVLRYVERNPVRAELVRRARQWAYSSLGLRESGDERAEQWLSPWPVPRPEDWLERVNSAEPKEELALVRRSVVRGTPFGTALWQKRTAMKLGLESSLRPRGRPRKNPETTIAEAKKKK